MKRKNIKSDIKRHLEKDIKSFKEEAHEDREFMKKYKLEKENAMAHKKEHRKGEMSHIDHLMKKIHKVIKDHHKDSDKKEKHEKGEKSEKHEKKKEIKPKLKTKAAIRDFAEKRMHAFKTGHMHSRVRGTGPVVTNPKQAVAILLSEERKKGVKIPKKKK